jgi:butyrate kinase
MKLLIINPGSTSTKIAIFENESEIFSNTIRHSAEELEKFTDIPDQFEFRKNLILDALNKEEIPVQELDAVVARGGLLRPIESGVYEVNERMKADLRDSRNGAHASNLGGLIAAEIASKKEGCRAFIADPIVVDELQDVARITGIPELENKSVFHALNQKAIARQYAREQGKQYENLQLVIAHLGGGITVAAHKKGRVVDVNNGLDGTGPFSPERAGTLPARDFARLCFSGKYTEKEIMKLISGRGGIMAHLGSNDMHETVDKAEKGNPHAKLIVDAMAYNIAKEIGAKCVVLEGKADAIILTGGIAYSNYIASYITRMVSFLAPVVRYPGEDEMKALALSGLRILQGETAKEY